MSILSNAPLIEVIFEIRWGLVEEQEGGSLIKFTPEELTLLPGQLQQAFSYSGIDLLEVINKGIEIPHVVNFRYRKQPNSWPCYQLGKGIFTVNQINEGYDWDSYLKSIQSGLEIFTKIYKGGIESLPLIHLELKYQDGFFFSKDESSQDFLSQKMNIGYAPPDNFIKLPTVDEHSIKHNLSFSAKTIDPPGKLINSITDVHINGKQGLAMNTGVISTNEEVGNLSIDSITEWLSKAHDLQREAFKTLIEPTFAKSFK